LYFSVVVIISKNISCFPLFFFFLKVVKSKKVRPRLFVWRKLFSILFYVYLLLEKLVNRKHFPVKGKFSLVFRKVFRDVILFADYIKFCPQTFDCYKYIFLNIFFQFHHLEFDFYINFNLYFYDCYLLFSYRFLIKIFYLSNLVLILLIVTYFIWNNLWNCNYYYFNFIIF
jgi:hypothetical protein